VYNSQNTAKDLNMDISVAKTKIVAFQGKDSICSKTGMYNKVTEQVTCFKYLGHYIT